MNQTEHGHNPPEEPKISPVHHGHRPYWKRAHRDWRMWVGVILMLAAMAIYLMTDDLAWRPRLQPLPPASDSVEK